MILTSPYKPETAINILKEQIDAFPSFLKCVVTLNAHYYSGTSPVCGNVTDSGFELRNRSGPRFSLRAKGRLVATREGTNIEIHFIKPLVPDLWGMLFKRYKHDRQIIMTFLKEWLKITEEAAPSV